MKTTRNVTASCAASRLYRDNTKRASTILAERSSLTPNDPRLIVQRGINSTYLGDAQAALPWIEQVMRIDPFSASHYETDWVRALYACGRPVDAKAILQRSVRNDYDRHLWLATCSVEIGQEEQARKGPEGARDATGFDNLLCAGKEPWKKSEDAERIQAALLRASLPLGGPASSWALADADGLET